MWLYRLSGVDTEEEFLLRYCAGRVELKYGFCASDIGPSILYKIKSGRGLAKRLNRRGPTGPEE